MKWCGVSGILFFPPKYILHGTFRINNEVPEYRRWKSGNRFLGLLKWEWDILKIISPSLSTLPAPSLSFFFYLHLVFLPRVIFTAILPSSSSSSFSLSAIFWSSFSSLLFSYAFSLLFFLHTFSLVTRPINTSLNERFRTYVWQINTTVYEKPTNKHRWTKERKKERQSVCGRGRRGLKVKPIVKLLCWSIFHHT